MRTIVWFSCGAASAAAAKLTLERNPAAEVVYCDTLKYEHPDNVRFMRDVSRWIGKDIKIIKSQIYTDIFDVFDRTGFLVSPYGARCTTELKKIPRLDYGLCDDVNVFGLTADETRRIARFEQHNPELRLMWILRDLGIDKQNCLNMLNAAGIELPAMYKLGYHNNNCIGCVKGGAGYWNKIRRDFPEAFDRMARQERKMNRKILDVFLDELDPNAGRHDAPLALECGVVCSQPQLL